MKNLLNFKKRYTNGGLNNPLVEKIVEQLGYDKSTIPAYSKQIKLDVLKLNNKKVGDFLENLYQLTNSKILEIDTKENAKSLEEIRRDLKASATALVGARDKFFKNEIKGYNTNDAIELAELDIKIRADKKEINARKKEQREILNQIEYQYKKENGYIL